MRNMKFLGMAFLLAFASFVSFASAGVPDDAIIRTIPAQSVWVADGVTEYRVDIYVDTTQTPGEITDGVQWRLVKPQGLQNNIVITRAELPAQVSLIDFFPSNATYFQHIFNTNPWTITQKRIVNIGYGVSPSQGYVGSYWFKVMPGVGKTSTSFTLSHERFFRPDGSNIPYHVENVPFTVIPRQIASTNAVICDDLSC